MYAARTSDSSRYRNVLSLQMYPCVLVDPRSPLRRSTENKSLLRLAVLPRNSSKKFGPVASSPTTSSTTSLLGKTCSDCSPPVPGYRVPRVPTRAPPAGTGTRVVLKSDSSDRDKPVWISASRLRRNEPVTRVPVA
eukprot:3234940-Rhodomonas_salina.1